MTTSPFATVVHQSLSAAQTAAMLAKVNAAKLGEDGPAVAAVAYAVARECDSLVEAINGQGEEKR